MKKYILYILCLIFFSCSEKKEADTYIKNTGFIKIPGKYHLKRGCVIIKEFNDGSLIMGISDRYNRIQYQTSVFESFSNQQYWTIYVDERQNLWFYCSDYQIFDVFVYNKNANSYTIVDINSIDIPPALTKELKDNYVNMERLKKMLKTSHRKTGKEIIIVH